MPSQQASGLEAAVDIEFTEADLAAEAPSSVGSAKVQPIAATPFGKKVLDKLNERDQRPDVQLRSMVAEAREKLAELDDKREKLEAFREVQIFTASELHDAVKGSHLKSIEHHEAQIAAIRQLLDQGDIDQRQKLADINANVDAQVDAIDTMETIHRNVVNSAPAKPKRSRRTPDKDIPF